MSDEAIPDTSHQWATAVGNNIPRSKPNDVYRPVKLSDFLTYVKEKSDLYPPVKQAILELIDEFKQQRSNGNGR